MDNKNQNKINTKTSKLFGILTISVIATLMISTPIIQYAYATDAPIITSLIADDSDNGDTVFSKDDTLTITFDSPTDNAGGSSPQVKADVDKLFVFSDSLGQAYNGQWNVSGDTFTIKSINVDGSSPPEIGTTTVTPVAGAIFSADGTLEASSDPSLLTGDFGVAPPTSWIIGEGLIYYDGGNVGIGTTLPNHLLSVNGVIESTSGGFKFPDGTVQSTASTGTYQASTNNAVQTGFVNSLDQPFTYNCPAGKVITGVYAEHHNDQEDRKFKFTCSNIQTVIP